VEGLKIVLKKGLKKNEDGIVTLANNLENLERNHLVLDLDITGIGGRERRKEN